MLFRSPRYLRAFAKQRLDDEIVFEDANKLATNRFRPYGVVCPRLFLFRLTALTSLTRSVCRDRPL